MNRVDSIEQQDKTGRELLRLARGSIEYGFVHRDPLPVDLGEWPPSFAEPGATFTSLHLEGQLRGCCGTLEARLPLAESVTRSAYRAAFRDPRFEPVAENEFGAITVEVSVLSPLEPVTVIDERDLLSQLEPGTDGLVIIAGSQRATLLPQVWESFPDPRRFLAALKAKCGLPQDYWSEELEFQRYRTTSYAESG